ncbi:MAG: SRPBCC family protein [Phycisphaerales bacterium]|nr:SRPBCC family protein [Hyphomonadaceae bacterium]
MRWFLGFVLVIALVTGALYAVGRFLLPNALEVTRTTEIDRPRASVFAMINDLNIAKEWSPYYARDPNAEFAISPDPGAGQSMRWSSNVREVGSGRMSIVNSMENQSVEGIIQIGERATLNSRLDLEAREGVTSVGWSVGAVCAEGWVNVPCRYMNLIMRSTIEKELDSGLTRLKDRAEQLPASDFEGFDIIEVAMPPQDVMFVDVTLSNVSPSFAEGYQAEQRGIEALESAVAAGGGQADRSKLIRAFPQDNGAGGRYRFSVGYEYSGPAPMLVGSRVAQTPGGPTLRGTFIGRRSQVAQMYQRLEAFRQAHRIGLRPGAEYWEVVTPEPQPESADPTTDPVQRIEIYFPIENRGERG